MNNDGTFWNGGNVSNVEKVSNIMPDKINYKNANYKNANVAFVFKIGVYDIIKHKRQTMRRGNPTPANIPWSMGQKG